MTVGKISSARLAAVFAGLSDGQGQTTRQVQAEAEPAESAGSEAVKLSKSLEKESSARSERVDKIKELVASGDYFKQVKTEDVARSVIMGLFS